MAIVAPVVNVSYAGGALGFVEGSVTISAGTAPSVTGDLTVTLPSSSASDVLNPQQSPVPRVTIEVEGRLFDLHVRDISVDQDDERRATITLASDEALLDDYRALEDDTTPLTMQDSLRDIVEYVLDTVLPGTTLEAGPDEEVPALADSVNLMRNPRRAEIWDWQWSVGTGSLDVGTYATGGPAYAPTYFYFGATGGDATGAIHYYDEANLSVQGNKDYRLSVDLQVPAGLTVTLDAVLFDSSGNVVGYATPMVVGSAPGVWQRVQLPFFTQPTTARVRPRVIVNGTLPNGVYVNVTAWRLSDDNGDPADYSYFDGNTTVTDQYDYTFADEAWSSPSHRTTLIDAADPEALIWKAGETGLDFLSPLIQRFGYRLVCDELRQWTLRGDDYTAAGSVDVNYGANMHGGSDTIGRDLGVWMDARVTRYIAKGMDGTSKEVVDSFALNDPPTYVTYLEVPSAYPGPGRSEYAVRRAQGRAREVRAMRLPDWTETAEQPATILLLEAPAQSGKTQAVRFNLGENEVEISVRTVDTAPGSIDLSEGVIDDATGTIDTDV